MKQLLWALFLVLSVLPFMGSGCSGSDECKPNGIEVAVNQLPRMIYELDTLGFTEVRGRVYATEEFVEHPEDTLNRRLRDGGCEVAEAENSCTTNLSDTQTINITVCTKTDDDTGTVSDNKASAEGQP